MGGPGNQRFQFLIFRPLTSKNDENTVASSKIAIVNPGKALVIFFIHAQSTGSKLIPLSIGFYKQAGNSEFYDCILRKSLLASFRLSMKGYNKDRFQNYCFPGFPEEPKT